MAKKKAVAKKKVAATGLLNFRQRARGPLNRALTRLAKTHPNEVAAIRKDSRKMAELEKRVENLAKKQGAYRALNRLNTMEAGRFQDFFAWLIANGPAIIEFIRLIVSLFGGGMMAQPKVIVGKTSRT